MSKTKHRYYLIHKPYKVLSQFTNEGANPGLGTLYTDLPKHVYPVGRLDLDSEGLLILSDDKSLNDKLLNPKNKHQRTYWVQVDGIPSASAISQLSKGVQINVNGKPHQTQKAEVRSIAPQQIADRLPPVNYQKHPITSWLEIKLTEGKNRQVRRMTAKVGHPTLRLIRVAIESVELGELRSGDITQVSKGVLLKKLNLF